MRALSLEYHDVVAGDDADATGFPGAGPASYKIALADFEAHLDAIRAAVRTEPTRATDWLTGGDATGRPLFITFDDGGVSAIGCIADALERRGWRGHFFMTAGRVDTPGFLSGSELREMVARGHVIGSHSYSHPKRMGGCPEATIAEEWRRSVAVLQDALGGPILTASVPGGFYTRPVGVHAAAAGIRVLFTSAPTTRAHEVDGCRILGRYTLRKWSPAAQAAGLAAGAWRPRAGQWAFYSTLDLVRRIAGDHYTTIRQLFWARRG
jgi:peptidoglycan/xylan/chitin deacetylase (PgdA/CDA1 family)